MKLLILTSLVLVGVSLTVLADVFLKKSSVEQWHYFVIGLLLYASIALPVALAFRLTEFGVLFIIWEAATVMLGLATAIILFGEALTLQRAAALILSLAAMLLAYWE